MFRLHVWLVVCEHSCYATAWQAVLTAGFRVPACSRTNTDSVLYLFLACTRPPDFDTDRGAKTRIAWQLQSNERIVLRPHLRTTKRPTPQKMRKPVLAWQPQHIFVVRGSAACGLTVKSLHVVCSSRIYRKHRTTNISDWHVIAALQLLCWRAHLLARFRRLVEIEFRFLRYFTDAWNMHQQDDFIFRNVYSLV